MTTLRWLTLMCATLVLAHAAQAETVYTSLQETIVRDKPIALGSTIVARLKPGSMIETVKAIGAFTTVQFIQDGKVKTGFIQTSHINKEAGHQKALTEAAQTTLGSEDVGSMINGLGGDNGEQVAAAAGVKTGLARSRDPSHFETRQHANSREGSRVVCLKRQTHHSQTEGEMIVKKHALILVSTLALLGCAHGEQFPTSADDVKAAAQDQADLTTTQMNAKANSAIKDQTANLVANAAMSKAIAVELLRKMPLIDDARTLIYVNTVGQYVAQELVPSLKCRTDGTPWSDVRVGIVKSKTPAAFSLPGGILFVTTSMMQKFSSEDELAGVLANEIVTSVCGKGLPADLAMQAATGWSNYIANLPTRPLSRGDLLFADKYALVTLYRRGYDLTPYVKFLAKSELSGRHGYGIERAAVLEKSVSATPPIISTQNARMARFNAAKAKSI